MVRYDIVILHNFLKVNILVKYVGETSRWVSGETTGKSIAASAQMILISCTKKCDGKRALFIKARRMVKQEFRFSQTPRTVFWEFSWDVHAVLRPIHHRRISWLDEEVLSGRVPAAPPLSCSGTMCSTQGTYTASRGTFHRATTGCSNMNIGRNLDVWWNEIYPPWRPRKLDPNQTNEQSIQKIRIYPILLSPFLSRLLSNRHCNRTLSVGCTPGRAPSPLVQPGDSSQAPCRMCHGYAGEQEILRQR